MGVIDKTMDKAINYSMSDGDKKHICEALEHAASESEAIFKEFNKNCRDAKALYVSSVEGTYREKILYSQYMKDLMVKLYNQFIVQFQGLYNTVETMFRWSSEAYNTKCKIDMQSMQDSKNIQAYALNNSLYVKLPRVPVKPKYYKNRLDLFHSQLKLLLDDIAKNGQMPHLKKKSIIVINVFDGSTVHEWIPDNDNYDLKRLFDLLIGYVGGGDGGLVCDHHYYTIISEHLLPGTYIVICPMRTVVDLKKIVCEAEKIFAF